MKYLVLVSSLFIAAATSAAQVPTTGAPASPPEAAALRECTSLADAGKGAEAESRGRLAASTFKKRLEQNPRDVEAMVGAARAMSQCLVPAAGFLEQGELSSEAMELLDRAIEIEPDHWVARFVLASIAYRSPAFLGRGKRAAQEFDHLLRMQGNRTDNPMFARVFALRGTQLSRQGQTDSARALWKRGASLFPEDAELKKLSTPPAGPDTVASTAPAASPAPTTSTLATVKVVAATAPPKPTLPSLKEVSRSQVLMTAGGTADVLQAVQMQPGATRVGEGADVYTRGGDASETSLIVNGGRLLSLSRFEGLNGSMFGAIEPFVVKSVRYSSGGFSARYGNALSGVLEIETDGRPRERQTRAGVSLVQASGTFRAPLMKKLGGWVSARASHTGVLLGTHGRSDEFDGAPRSQELIASLIAAPSPFAELRATTIIERDDSRRYLTAGGLRGTFDSRGDTRAVGLSSRWLSSSNPLVIRGTVSGTSRSSDWGFGVLSRDRDESSVVTRVDAEFEAAAGVMVRAGVEQGTQSRLERGTVPTTSSVVPGAPVRALGDARSSANQVGTYAETELTRGRMSLTTGLRADRLPGEVEATIDPRVAIAMRGGDWTTRISGGLFHQGRWRGDAAIPDGGTPSGLPRAAQHLVLGLERSRPSSVFRAEAFVKRYADYRKFGDGPSIEGALARGVDMIAQRLSGTVTGWIAYSYLDATSRLADRMRVRSAFDVTHTATGSITATLNTDWSIGSTMRYGTGAPRTPITQGRMASDGRIAPVYGALMSERLPAYGRLDARVMRYIRTPGFLLTTFVELLNTTNRANVSTYTYDPTYTSREAVPTFFSKRTIVMGGEFMFR